MRLPQPRVARQAELRSRGKALDRKPGRNFALPPSSRSGFQPAFFLWVQAGCLHYTTARMAVLREWLWELRPKARAVQNKLSSAYRHL